VRIADRAGRILLAFGFVDIYAGLGVSAALVLAAAFAAVIAIYSMTIAYIDQTRTFGSLIGMVDVVFGRAAMFVGLRPDGTGA
jgi:hypothetical protein